MSLATRLPYGEALIQASRADCRFPLSPWLWLSDRYGLALRRPNDTA
jgi:hypothetical protein